MPIPQMPSSSICSSTCSRPNRARAKIRFRPIAAILRIFRNSSARSGRSFADAETQALRDYLADLDARGFKSSSVARRLSAMRHLFRFLINERIRSDDPAAILSGPKRGRACRKC